MRLITVAIFAVLVAATPLCASAQTSGNATSATQKERDAQRARALARCKADRGVNCDTPQGLNEWVLQERSRAQAMREGSRRGSPEPEPVQPKK
jgi:hypothetical protein